LRNLKKGSKVNLERAMQAGARLHGHMVQGHIDQVATVTKIEEAQGSWNVEFQFQGKPKFTLVDKGSVCIDGTSLTVVSASGKNFSVSIIPYTFQHTIFSTYKPGTEVNIEFDVIGKYVERILDARKKKYVKFHRSCNISGFSCTNHFKVFINEIIYTVDCISDLCFRCCTKLFY
jgi:riboflavin synthase